MDITTLELSAIDRAIDDWFAQSFHGGALARATDAYNEVHAAKESLKSRIAALFAPQPISTPGTPSE